MRPTRVTCAPQALAWAACCLLGACLCAPPLAAQVARPRIAKITVQGARFVAPQQVLEGLGIAEGQPWDSAKFEAAVKAWNSAGLYGTISYRIEPAPEGAVELILTLAERVQVTGVSFEGNQRISSRRLEERIGLSAGAKVSQADVANAERQIIAAYDAAGYPSAQAKGEIVTRAPGQRQLVFHVQEGPAAWVESIEFEGNRGVPGKVLRRLMESSTRGWISWIWPGWFNEETFHEDIGRVEKAYRDRGYLDAKVTGQPLFSEDMTRVRLRVIVQEGALYRVKTVQFEGNTIFRDSELLAATRIVVGGPYRPDDLAAAATAISALYADQGYWDVTVPKGNLRIEEAIPAEGTEVTLKFHITEGAPVTIGRVEIRGLSKTKEEVVRRDLTFYPGEVAAASKFRESERVLANTGYFVAEPPKKPVQIELAPGEGPLRDAIVRVEEGPTGRFLVTAGVGSDSGLLGGVTIEEANFDISRWPASWRDIWEGNAFRGAGQRMSILLQAGTKRSFYAISWENPSVNNSAYGVGTMLYSRGTTRSEFFETRTGANVTLTQHLWKFVRRYATVGYEFITVEDIPIDSPDVLKDAEGTHSKPYVRAGAAVDRRDSRFMPTEGYQAGIEVELSAGDAHAAKLTAQGEKYWTVSEERGAHKQVLGVRGRIGLAQSYSGDLPVYERFYAGGFYSLRGFAFEGVSPAEKGTLIGGDSLLTGSVEYSLPLTEDDRLRLVTFCDAGYVGKGVGDIVSGWSELRASLGVGIRWQVPFLGPATIEIDLAAPILKQSQDQTQIISFSLGAEQRF